MFGQQPDQQQAAVRVARFATQGFFEFAHTAGDETTHVPIYIYDRLDDPTRGMLEDNLAVAEHVAETVAPRRPPEQAEATAVQGSAVRAVSVGHARSSARRSVLSTAPAIAHDQRAGEALSGVALRFVPVGLHSRALPGSATGSRRSRPAP